MYKIVRKKVLNPTVTLMDIDAPLVAKKAEHGAVTSKINKRPGKCPGYKIFFEVYYSKTLHLI